MGKSVPDIFKRKEDRLPDFHGIAAMKPSDEVIFGLNLFDQPFPILLTLTQALIF